jgi:hypothetical protein
VGQSKVSVGIFLKIGSDFVQKRLPNYFFEIWKNCQSALCLGNFLFFVRQILNLTEEYRTYSAKKANKAE